MYPTHSNSLAQSLQQGYGRAVPNVVGGLQGGFAVALSVGCGRDVGGMWEPCGERVVGGMREGCGGAVGGMWAGWASNGQVAVSALGSGRACPTTVIASVHQPLYGAVSVRSVFSFFFSSGSTSSKSVM